jgi:hypothetical protein
VVLSQVKAQIDPVKYPTFTNIEDALKSKKAVYSMSFREKGLFNLPPQIVKLDSLFFLNMMGNKLEKMDQELFALKELKI